MYKYNIFLKKILHKSCDFLPQYIMDGYPTPMADFKVNKLGQLFTCPSTPLITILCAIIMSGIKRRSSAISPKLKMVENTDRRKTFSNTMPTYITHCSMQDVRMTRQKMSIIKHSHTQPLFLYFLLFKSKNLPALDSNPGPLASEVTVLPIVPQSQL